MGNIDYRLDNFVVNSAFAYAMIQALRPYAAVRGAERADGTGAKVTVPAWLIRDRSGAVADPPARGQLPDFAVLDAAVNGSFVMVCGTNAFDYPRVSVTFNGSVVTVTISADDLNFDQLVRDVRELTG